MSGCPTNEQRRKPSARKHKINYIKTKTMKEKWRKAKRAEEVHKKEGRGKQKQIKQKHMPCYMSFVDAADRRDRAMHAKNTKRTHTHTHTQELVDCFQNSEDVEEAAGGGGGNAHPRRFVI